MSEILTIKKCKIALVALTLVNFILKIKHPQNGNSTGLYRKLPELMRVFLFLFF